MAFRAPLLGYNTNVRHKGKLYHIQTEDSGINHPHVITHLFADGGRIVASKKTGYAEHVGADSLQETVKKLMQGQHKAMFIALRDGVYDDDVATEAGEPGNTREVASIPAHPPGKKPSEPERPAVYQNTQSALQGSEKPPAPARNQAKPVSIFGGDLLSEKSLDEVILSYLATDDSE